MTAAELRLAVRFARRDLRAGLKGFVVFVTCIALGVAAIAGVGSLARALTDGLAAEGRSILGGDLDVSLVHREASRQERGFLDGLGRVSEMAALRAMARTADGAAQALVEVKAVDGAYPLAGTMRLGSGGSLDAALAVPAGTGPAGPFPGVADPELLGRLKLAVGDTVALGRTAITLVDTVAREPDRLSGGIDFGPRLMLPRAGLDASGLVQPGSLVRWHYRVALPGDGEGRLAAVTKTIEEAFPQAGWRVQPRTEASPGLARNIDRFAQFLTLVGLTALIVGGVGVANAVAALVERKRPVIATLRSLGASGDLVFATYLLEVIAIAGVGIAIGLVVGAAIPPIAGRALASLLPVPALGGLYPRELAVAVVYGLLTALAFSLWPLGRAHDIAPSLLFRDRAAPAGGRPRRRYVVATGLVVAALAAIAVGLAADRSIALAFVAGAGGAFLMLRLVAGGLMALARRAPRVHRPELRLALANIHRPGALTPTVVLSLGLGLTLLVALALVDTSLRTELTGRLPATAPSFFFLDVQDAEVKDFTAFLATEAPGATVERQPMLRGRIVSLKGIAAADYPAPPSAEWVLKGDRGITYAPTLPEGSKIVAGAWWPADYAGPPLVSFAADLAEELGVGVGDAIVVNVLGREIAATVGSLRTVDWQTLGINFVLVFSPNAFAGAPHAHLATLTFPGGAPAAEEIALLNAVGKAFPTVTAVRVKEALEAVNALLSDLAVAVRAAASIALVASVLVLAGALAASHASRIYDAVILKTLGATRARLVAAFALEYLMLGLATALFALLAGAAAAWGVLAGVMDVPFTPDPGAAAGAVAAALVVTVGLGLVGTWRMLGAPVAPVLRDL